MGKVKGRGKRGKKKCPRSKFMVSSTVVWPEVLASGECYSQAYRPMIRASVGPKSLKWCYILTRRQHWASKSSVIKSWNEGLKCQHKHQRSRVWPPGRAIPSIRPEMDFLGQGACWLPWCQRQKQPKLRLKIKQAYGSTSCGKKVETCFRILHQEDNEAVSSYTDRHVVGLTTQVRYKPYPLEPQNLLIDFVLENVQVVGGCHSYHIIFGVPRGMQDLLVEVQAVHADFILLPLPTCGNFPWFQSSSWFAALSGSLQCDVPPGVAVKHSEEVIVGPSHYGTVTTIPAALKLVKDTVIFIQWAEFTPKIFMDLICFHWPIFHV